MTLLRLHQSPIMFFVTIFKTTVLKKVNDKDDESTEDCSFSSTQDLKPLRLFLLNFQQKHQR